MIQPQKNISIAQYTNYKIGGVARDVYFPKNTMELYETFVAIRKANTPFYILGGGSNVLVGDGYWDGAVIITTGMNPYKTFGDCIMCGAGLETSRVAEIALENGKTGLEFLYLLPGSIGGALAMNARYDMINISDVLIDFTAVHPEKGIKIFNKDEAGFAYKINSVAADGWYITEMSLRWENGNIETIRNRMDSIREKRDQGGHFEFPSCGCIFKNDYERNIQVGRLLDEMGFKGYTHGGSQVSNNHANFINNMNNATARDVLSIIEHIEHEVKTQKGIELQREVRLLGTF
ncbi:MAG: UDP-N-acetylmuramate dehydrogenase [Candidatus Latescibacteria bacterium]|nr:UDP-N-acetylmuramate dehydrogenase [Candidatus Latescibacterota bacterium]